MPEFHNDSLVPQKYGVLSPFAKFTWCLLIVIGLAVIALFVAKFDLERLRGSSYFIEKAQQAIERKDWGAAVGAIHRVQGPARDEPEFLRVVADFLEATQGEPAMLESILNKLDVLGQMQPADYIWACRLQVAVGKVDAARKALDRIPASMRQTADVMKLGIDLLRQEGRLREAAEMEKLLFEKFTDDPEIAFRKAVNELEGTFPEVQQAALNQLWEIAKRHDKPGIDAIRLLSRRKDLTLSETSHLREIADKHPDIAVENRLAIISILMRLDPMRRDSLLAQQVKLYEKGDSVIQAQLAAWLAKEEEYDKVLALIPEEMWMKSPDLFPQVAQGLAEKKKWSELLNLVKKGKKPPVSNARTATWRALATKNLQPDNLKEIRSHVEEAIREGLVEKDGLAVLGAARLAEEWAMTDLALKAYETLALPGSPQEANMLEKCWLAASTLKNSQALIKLAEKCAKLKPGNSQLVLRRDYMHLLCGEQLETTLTSTFEETPTRSSELESDSFLLLKALKAYRLHDPNALTLALGKIQNAKALTTGERAVYAGLQSFNGQTTVAYQLAESVRPELLLDEEMVFLRLAL